MGRCLGGGVAVMSKNDGGPAYPALSFIVPRDLHEQGVRRLGECRGMTLRDHFAAVALQALIAKTPFQLAEATKEQWK
mgnify:CR=1 FL=1